MSKEEVLLCLPILDLANCLDWFKRIFLVKAFRKDYFVLATRVSMQCELYSHILR